MRDRKSDVNNFCAKIKDDIASELSDCLCISALKDLIY